MNCFEARQDFRAFWRKELDTGRREALAAHLKECAKCDGAFRIFALSAPVLHSDYEPARIAQAAHGDRTQRRDSARRGAAVYREARGSRAWFSMAAAVTLFVAGAFAAYFSVATPVESLTDAISQPASFVELVSADAQTTGNDFAE
jgi:anti-sigma factor RsiW